MSQNLRKFTIIPILGRKTNVPQNDASLFQFVGEGIAMTHDVGGQNYDTSRNRNVCSKAVGSTLYTNSATSQATKTLGLFETKDGSVREHFICDNGKIFVLDGSLDPVIKEDAGSTTFANDDTDIYSMIQVGAYFIFADRAEHTPYKWTTGDANLTKLIQSGTEYKFRYLEQFQRRVIGCYCSDDSGAPELSVRWSTPWPSTAITSLNFPAGNQAYISNDDPLVGIKRMGNDRCFIYCENSIQALDYYADYEVPFRIRNVVADQGFVNHHSIVAVGDKHYGLNKAYGFCEFRGTDFPAGGRPISENIEGELQDINSEYLDLTVGRYIPGLREICWAVPMDGDTNPNRLLFWNVETREWRTETKAERYVDLWKLYTSFTFTDLTAAVGGSGYWSDAGSNTWTAYTQARESLVYSETAGTVFSHSGTTENGSNINGYRIEPIMDFGDPFRRDTVQEIWFEFDLLGDYSVDVEIRYGDTVAEVSGASWMPVGSISCNSPTEPRLSIHENVSKRLYQIKWGTDAGDEPFRVNRITVEFVIGERH